MPKAKKSKVLPASSATTTVQNMQEAGPSSSVKRKTTGQPAPPPSPGRALRLTAGKTLRTRQAAFNACVQSFLKADDAWIKEQDLVERLRTALYRREDTRSKSKPKADAVAIHKIWQEDWRLEHRWGRGCANYLSAVLSTWQAEKDWQESRIALLELQKARLLRRMRVYRSR